MKQTVIDLARRYRTALRRHLKPGVPGNLPAAMPLGRRAVVLRLETLEMARIHEQGLIALGLTIGETGPIRRAERFFAEAIAPIIDAHRAARQDQDELHRVKGTLTRRTQELAATNRSLHRGVIRRKGAEMALKKSGVDYSRLLAESLQLQKRLRQLTHQVISAQENERRKISRELQDEIAQTLLGINVRLLALQQETRTNARGFKNEIASTQRLVAESTTTVRRVARKYRNA